MLTILKNSISLDNDGLNFYRDDNRHGSIGLGYTTYSWWSQKEEKTFEHGLVFHTSSANDGGFAIRDDYNNLTTLTYNNNSKKLSLSNVYYISTKKGFSLDVIQKVICDLWGMAGSSWTYTFNYYYAGVLVMNSGSEPVGYSVYSTGQTGRTVMWYYS